MSVLRLTLFVIAINLVCFTYSFSIELINNNSSIYKFSFVAGKSIWNLVAMVTVVGKLMNQTILFSKEF